MSQAQPTVGLPASITKRVIFAMNDLGNLGGIQTVIDSLAQEFSARGLEVEYLTLNPPAGDPRIAGRVFVLNKGRSLTSDHPLAQEYRGPFGIKYILKQVLKLPWIIYRSIRTRLYFETLNSTDAVIFTQPDAGELMLKSGFRPTKKPKSPFTITQFHSSPAGLKAWSREKMLGQLISQTHTFLALCHDDALEFCSLFNTPVGVMSNPSSISGPTDSPRATPPRLTYVGRLVPEKRIGMAIQAFDVASQKIPDWEFHLYGDGISRLQLEKFAESRSCADRVFFHGRTDNIAEIFSVSTLAILASSFEGLPMTIIEGAVCGVPTVAITCSAGVRDIATECGYPVTDPSLNCLSDTLTHAMTDSASRRERSDRCYEVGAKHTPARIAEQWMTLFRDRNLGAMEAVSPNPQQVTGL